jgi:2,4-dienoyl-CoA reductase-like NADH-dependent reductase (Old Yellow Enzyme family)
MPTLFEPTRIKSMEIPNRIVRSATFEAMADEEGRPTEALFKLYRRLAKGGVGLIVTGYTYVSPDGRNPFPGMGAIDRDELIPDYLALTRRVHEHGAKIAMQIAHCGRQSSADRLGETPMAPSAVKDRTHLSKPRAMTEEDIERVLEAFAAAARRVAESGFDAVQIHGAHGYLVSQFLSPHTNRRTDQWGGSVENRMRFVAEIYRRCRAHVGDDYPLLIKINAEDAMKRGLRIEEGAVMAEMMADMGFDGIEVSCGISEDGMSSMRGEVPIEAFLSEWPMYRKSNFLFRFLMRRFGRRVVKPPPLTEAFNRAAAAAIRERTRVPLFLVGGITDPAVMEEIVESGEADYISLCRALIADARFPNQIRAGRREPSPCMHCNLCLAYVGSRAVRCYRGRVPPA